ncbi:MAG: SIS domain-containing protein [bacterium]|nr:SIS domain-containing protein [bacterium]
MVNLFSSFNQQHNDSLVVHNSESLKRYSGYVVAGMGGSGVGAGILKTAFPSLALSLHQSYGLPQKMLQDGSVCLVASSYSGETEEVLDAFHQAIQAGIPVAVVASGGKLLQLAQEHKVPYIVLPNIKAPPRFAKIVSSRAIALLMAEKDIEQKIASAAEEIDLNALEQEAKELGEKIVDSFPLLISSSLLSCVALYWQMALAETAKVPSSLGVIPEFTHNHMAAWGDTIVRENIVSKSSAVLFVDKEDDPRVLKRIKLLSSILQDRGVSVHAIQGRGSSLIARVLELEILGDYVGISLSARYGVDPQDVSAISEFKRRMSA